MTYIDCTIMHKIFGSSGLSPYVQYTFFARRSGSVTVSVAHGAGVEGWTGEGSGVGGWQVLALADGRVDSAGRACGGLGKCPDGLLQSVAGLVLVLNSTACPIQTWRDPLFPLLLDCSQRRRDRSTVKHPRNSTIGVDDAVYPSPRVLFLLLFVSSASASFLRSFDQAITTTDRIHAWITLYVHVLTLPPHACQASRNLWDPLASQAQLPSYPVALLSYLVSGPHADSFRSQLPWLTSHLVSSQLHFFYLRNGFVALPISVFTSSYVLLPSVPLCRGHPTPLASHIL